MKDVLLLVAGLGVLVAGADAAVRGGSGIAARFRIRPVVVGMTVVALGTSLPELAIGVSAVQDDRGDLAVGNIVGTNLVNTLLVLGLAALLRPIVFERRTLRVDIPAGAAAALLLFLLARDGGLAFADGAVLTGFGVAYLIVVLVSGRQVLEGAVPDGAGEAGPAPPKSVVGEALALGLGLAAIVVGAELLVHATEQLARSWGLSDAVIGLTVVAIGTSAPEMVTVVVSTIRGDHALALGNLLGSNVFNVALVLGATTLLAPATIPVPEEVIRGDLLLMTVAMLACIPAFWTQSRLSRLEGAAFVGAYLVYLATVLTG